MALKPWREIVTPHPDVAGGRYRQAEFAADLAQVLKGTAEPEYQDPIEFFGRTFITDGMTRLLVSALERVSARGGEPVVQLKTAFGGGKTHTMLALYHLLGGKVSADRLPGIADILKQANVTEIPHTKIAVLVGTALNPTRQDPPRTLWGVLARQLGGREGAEKMSAADAAGVAPGSDDLVELFDTYGPCLILIDELVAFARNIYGVNGLPSGSFDANMTFVQSLTEAVRRSKASMLVATIPESNIEIGGEGGKAALERIENTFGRIEAVWKPVGAQEGFEVVRRRLFVPIKEDKLADRDEVCRAFTRMYAESEGKDYPSACKEGIYAERMQKCYPIHPELFDRLYEDWSTLEKFQRTRGVLRLMAAAIHELWVANDQSLMIMPGSVPIYAPRVREELTRYLSDGWNAVVDSDVDGVEAEPGKIDQTTRFGQYSAARRVARATFIGSAPSVKAQHIRGVEDMRIRLGVVQPGESVPLFNDALNQLTDRLKHLYAGNKRYWFDLQPNLIRTADERAGRLEPHEIEAEITKRLRDEVSASRRGRLDLEQEVLKGVHVCPAGSQEVPDEQEVRLVVLSPAFRHSSRGKKGTALSEAQEILLKRGNADRHHRNMLVFLVPDEEAMVGLEYEIKYQIAWKSILSDSETTLNLDGFQKRQAEENYKRHSGSIEAMLRNCYCWLLVPSQERGENEITLECTRITSSDDLLLPRAVKKLKSGESVITRWSPVLLKNELDRDLWGTNPHLQVKLLWSYFTRYCYMPRLRDQDVLLQAIRDGIRSQDFFGYAAGVKDDGKYLGLAFGSAGGNPIMDEGSVLVRPEVAAAVIEVVAPQEKPNGKPKNGESTPNKPTISTTPTGTTPPPPELFTVTRKRFHGTTTLNPTRLNRDASQIAEEILHHLTQLPNANVVIHLEIEADIPEGIPDDKARTLSENCKTLNIKFGFEEE